MLSLYLFVCSYLIPSVLVGLPCSVSLLTRPIISSSPQVTEDGLDSLTISTVSKTFDKSNEYHLDSGLMANRGDDGRGVVWGSEGINEWIYQSAVPVPVPALFRFRFQFRLQVRTRARVRSSGRRFFALFELQLQVKKNKSSPSPSINTLPRGSLETVPIFLQIHIARRTHKHQGSLQLFSLSSPVCSARLLLIFPLCLWHPQMLSSSST